MARLVMALRLELGAVSDAIGDLELIMRALTRRHGDRFRALERKIEQLTEPGVLQAPDLHPLGDGLFVDTPSTQLTHLIAEARRLGVI